MDLLVPLLVEAAGGSSLCARAYHAASLLQVKV